MSGAGEQRQGTGVAEDDVVDPVVWLGRGRDQGLEVQIIESAVGNDDDARAGADELLCGRNEHVVELAATGIASLERIARAEQGLAVVLYGGIDFGIGGQLEERDVVRRDRPEIGLPGLEPVFEDDSAGLLRDLFWGQRRVERGGFQSEAFGEGASAAVLGDAKGVVRSSVRDEEVDVAVVKESGRVEK